MQLHQRSKIGPRLKIADFMRANNQCVYQPALPRRLISTFVIRSLENEIHVVELGT